jgi:hypothetical protein
MITLSIYKEMGKQCGGIRNLHKSVKTLCQTVEQSKCEGAWGRYTSSLRSTVPMSSISILFIEITSLLTEPFF